MDNILERVRGWLAECPALPAGFTVDYAPPADGGAGLFPQGVRELWRKRDIRGGCTVRRRCSFLIIYTLYKGEGGADDAANAAGLLALQAWIAGQSMAGLAPVLGNTAPQAERIWAEDGKYHAASGGVGEYRVMVHAEFTTKARSE